MALRTSRISGREKLDALSPFFKPYIDFLLDYSYSQGISVDVISAHRTEQEQQRAAAQAQAAGRPAAAPGRSAHQYGLAVDLVAGGHSSSSEHQWLMRVWKAMGGYFWPGDDPHFEHPAWRHIREYLR